MSKKQIHIRVEDKIASLVDDEQFIVCGNDDYELVFDFSEEWEDSIVKTALFVFNDTVIEQPFGNNVCEGVAIENATVCAIGVYADNIKTTTPAYVCCRISIKDIAGGKTPEAPSDTVYDKIIELINSFVSQSAGGTFIPHISDDGILSWTNDKGLENPPPVSVVGVGVSYIEQTTTSTEDGGTNVVTVTLTNGNKYNFNIRNGNKGSKGNDGLATYVATSTLTEFNTTITDFPINSIVTGGRQIQLYDLIFINGRYLYQVSAVYPTVVYINRVGDFKGEKGDDGKSAYRYAQDGGYKGTEAEFAAKLAKEIPSKTSDLTNDSKFITASGAPVQSVNGKSGAVTLGADDVGARPSTWMPTYSEVGADKSGAAATAVSEHNVDPESHNDIRLLIVGLADRLNALANSDDTTLDQMKEVVDYIKSNRGLIEQITTKKINYTDIVDNLTTHASDKPLSAARGVYLKGHIDALYEKKLDSSALTNAINAALAQAKASGEFNGEKGDAGVGIKSVVQTTTSTESGGTNVVTVTKTDNTSSTFSVKNGKDGTSVSVSSVSESTTSGGSNVTTFSDGKTLTVKNGYTPVKGKDYYTEADREEIVQAVLASMGAAVYGFVDEDNNIVLTGALANDTYSIKYEMEDGSTIDIGTLDTNTYYSITNNLTNCTNDNNATEAVHGKSYSATISAYSGHALSSLVVTMGGTDVTSSAVSGRNINIANVTGDIVITAVAEVAEVRTNFFDASSGFIGRLSSTGADRTDSNVTYVTNYIPVQNGDIMLISGCTISGKFASTSDYFYMTGYNSNKSNVYTGTVKNGNGYWTVETPTSAESQLTVLNANIAYMRLVCADSAYHDISVSSNGIAVDTSKIVINIKRNGKWL